MGAQAVGASSAVQARLTGCQVQGNGRRTVPSVEASYSFCWACLQAFMNHMHHAMCPANLFTVRTGTVSGKPARNMAMRHSFARWELGPSTLPTTMSPTACSKQQQLIGCSVAKEHHLSPGPVPDQAQELCAVQSRLSWLDGGPVYSRRIAPRDSQALRESTRPCAGLLWTDRRGGPTSGSTPLRFRVAASTAANMSSAGQSFSPPRFACSKQAALMTPGPAAPLFLGTVWSLRLLRSSNKKAKG